MAIYRCRFNGRLVNALGITSSFDVLVAAKDEDAALLKLYDTHESISGVQFQEFVVKEAY